MKILLALILTTSTADAQTTQRTSLDILGEHKIVVDKGGMCGDGLRGIEPDKVGELGLAYLYFYEVTSETVYLNAALQCADALAKNVRDVGGYPDYFTPSEVRKSSWPFRVNARTGLVIDEYCSNVIEPIRLFDELL